MLNYRGTKLIRAGIIGVVAIVLVIVVGLQPQRLQELATSVQYQARFTEASGLAAGNDVTLSGIKIGRVSAVALDHGEALVTFTATAKYLLGSETTAHIRTATLLGQRVLTLEPAGQGHLRPSSVIPDSRTSSPYSLNEATSELTSNTAGTDTQAVNRSLDTLSATLDRLAPHLGPAFEGLTRLSRAINGRDAQLGELLKSAANVTGILGQRSQQVNTLILNGNDLLGTLVKRQHAIVDLLAYTSTLAQQLSGLVADNEKQLAPALEQLNSVTAMLEKNRDNIGKALPGLAKYQITQGEAVSNGAYYNAFLANLLPGQTLQPFMDYAFGFRRGNHAGQPPDNAGPRAEFPWPHNGIPGGTR